MWPYRLKVKNPFICPNQKSLKIKEWKKNDNMLPEMNKTL